MAEVKIKAPKRKVEPVIDPPMDFAGNSHISKKEGPIPSTEKKIAKVTQGRIEKVKKSPGRKISETFLADDAKNVMNYIFREVLIPAAKTTLSDLVSTGIDRLLYGGDASAVRRRSRTGGPTISYGRYFKEPNDSRYFREHTNLPPRSTTRSLNSARARQSFEDIVMDTRDDAEEVLTNLVELVDNYGIASLADFYDLVGLDTTFVDYKHGWDNLSRVNIIRVRDGYVLNLPRPISL